MDKEEIKNYVDDQVRHSTDSAIMALTQVLGDYNHKLEKHREEEIKFKEKILETIRSEIKITVNGKIDNIKKTQEQDRETSEQFRKEMREYMLVMRPIEDNFKEKTSAFKYLGKTGKTIVFISVVIGSLVAIEVFLKDVVHFLWKN